MSFQKLVILAVSMVFAAQGAMAAPSFRLSPAGVVSRQEDAHKHGHDDPRPQPILDSVLENTGDILGAVGKDVFPAEIAHAGIKGLGGVAPRQEDAHKHGHDDPRPQPILDSVLENAGDILGAVGKDVFPAEIAHAGIKGLGGVAPRQEDAHKHGHDLGQPILDSILEYVGGITGIVMHDVLPAEATDAGIKGAGGTVPQ